MKMLLCPGRSRSLAVFGSLLSFVVGSVTMSGCTNPTDVVVQDTKGQKNKRTARIDKLKGGKPATDVKKAGQ
jgi:hypothetical protein